jgi:hypothetical protein
VACILVDATSDALKAAGCNESLVHVNSETNSLTDGAQDGESVAYVVLGADDSVDRLVTDRDVEDLGDAHDHLRRRTD